LVIIVRLAAMSAGAEPPRGTSWRDVDHRPSRDHCDQEARSGGTSRSSSGICTGLGTPRLHQRYPRLTAPPVAPPTTATVRPLMPQESRRCTEATSVITPDLTATVTASRANDSTQGKRGPPMSQLPPARSRGGIAVWAVSAGTGVSSVSRDYTR
jgi:hypothetical protein